MRFYLGTHEPGWLERSPVPLFVSDRRLKRRVSMPRARASWALDSGGFTELSMYGHWVTSARDYANRAERYRVEIGRLDFAAVQDWMCEPFMVQRTGLSIAEHQRRTIDSLHRLRDLAPEVPWLPVLQGWHRDDYMRHVDAYQASGVDLAALPRIGLGSVCRRQNTSGAARIVRELSNNGLRLHLFGYKRQGLPMVRGHAASSDSMAWSYRARRRGKPLPGCSHKSCSNCYKFAMLWREKTLDQYFRGEQLELFC